MTSFRRLQRLRIPDRVQDGGAVVWLRLPAIAQIHACRSVILRVFLMQPMRYVMLGNRQNGPDGLGTDNKNGICIRWARG
jgi:hypothetical protein